VIAPPGPPATDDFAQALIEEARRRQRRRRLVLAMSLLVVGAIGVTLALVMRGGSSTGRRGQPSSGSAGGRDSAIRLERPGALAVGADGTVYVADDGRNQIVARRPNGTLEVVAGTGKRGFSGDGGRAARAELGGPAGMTVASDGTLYFADSGNNRVRAISPRGIIRTVAGNGKLGWVESGTAARAATLGEPAAVTIGRDGRLYIASESWGEVLRLAPDGTLTKVAGVQGPEGVYGIGGPATRASADGPEGLAFDRAGNLFVAGFNTKTLLMVARDGTMRLPAGISSDYPSEGGLATTPDGRVLATNRTSILELTPHGARTVFDFTRARLAGIRGFTATGIAADRRGNLYLDTYPSGYANTSATALVEIHPDGSAKALWTS
jgi:sugar lactone lactonase YvrE